MNIVSRNMVRPYDWEVARELLYRLPYLRKSAPLLTAEERRMVESLEFSGETVKPVKGIHRAVFEAASQPNALAATYDHEGEAHSPYGWVVHLAGMKDNDLEFWLGTMVAAKFVYLVSDPTLDALPDLFCKNDEALSRLKALADREVVQTG